LKSGATVPEVMTADEGRRPSPDDETPANDASSTSPSTPPADPDARESESSHPPTDGSDPQGATNESETDGSVAGDENAPSTTARESGGAGNRPPDPVPGRSDESFARRLWTAESGPLFFLREIATSAGAVLLVGLLLFGVSGVWPPMVAVESGSMEPHMHKGDLVFITEPGRYTPDAAYGSTGVVTAESGAEIGYRSFGGDGSVVVYDDPGQAGPPIIHRAQFYVDAGENWYDRADPEYVSADSCRELRNCPAPHAGFITKGDANGRYDQASGIASPVRSSWITGIARLRIPYLGWVRLGLADVVRGQESTVLAAPPSHAVGSGSGAAGTAGAVQAASEPVDDTNVSAPTPGDPPASPTSLRVSGEAGRAPSALVATG
jgi:signal peptidase